MQNLNDYTFIIPVYPLIVIVDYHAIDNWNRGCLVQKTDWRLSALRGIIPPIE